MVCLNHTKSKLSQKHQHQRAFFFKIWCQVGEFSKIQIIFFKSCQNYEISARNLEQKCELSFYTYNLPSGVQWSAFKSKREARVSQVDGVDGMIWDWVSNVYFNFLYTLWVYKSCNVYLYIYSQKLSPTFLWISKFDVKLGCLDFIFKITICTCVFEKSCQKCWISGSNLEPKCQNLRFS